MHGGVGPNPLLQAAAAAGGVPGAGAGLTMPQHVQFLQQQTLPGQYFYISSAYV